MAKSKKRTKKTGGPYLAAAFLCEKTIEDKSDGSMSAIRIVDCINIAIPSFFPLPSEENRLPVALSGFVSFKTGYSPGKHAVQVRMISPTGKSDTPFEQTIDFKPEVHGGVNIRLNITVGVVNGGLFWMRVYLDGRCVARVPFQIAIQRVEPTQAQAAGAANSTQR
jgi:hypothetical protein